MVEGATWSPSHHPTGHPTDQSPAWRKASAILPEGIECALLDITIRAEANPPQLGISTDNIAKHIRMMYLKNLTARGNILSA